MYVTEPGLYSTEDQTQSLIHSRQVLYPLSHAPNFLSYLLMQNKTPNSIHIRIPFTYTCWATIHRSIHKNHYSSCYYFQIESCVSVIYTKPYACICASSVQTLIPQHTHRPHSHPGSTVHPLSSTPVFACILSPLQTCSHTPGHPWNNACWYGHGLAAVGLSALREWKEIPCMQKPWGGLSCLASQTDLDQPGIHSSPSASRCETSLDNSERNNP